MDLAGEDHCKTSITLQKSRKPVKIIESGSRGSRAPELFKVQETNENQRIWLPRSTVRPPEGFKRIGKQMKISEYKSRGPLSNLQNPTKVKENYIMKTIESGSRGPLADLQNPSNVKENKRKSRNLAPKDHCQTSRTLQKSGNQ